LKQIDTPDFLAKTTPPFKKSSSSTLNTSNEGVETELKDDHAMLMKTSESSASIDKLIDAANAHENDDAKSENGNFAKATSPYYTHRHHSRQNSSITSPIMSEAEGTAAAAAALTGEAMPKVPSMEEMEAQLSRSASIEDIEEAMEHQAHALDSYSQLQAVKYYLTSPRFWLMSVAILSWGMIFELISFLPLYFRTLLKQKYPEHYSEGLATMLTVSFNAGAIISISIAGILYDWLKQKVRWGRLIFSAAANVGSLICCIVLLFGLSSWMPIYVVVLACFFIGLCTAIGWYICNGVFSVEFSGAKHSAKLACLLDIVGYIAATTFDLGGGIIIERVGWTAFYGVLTVSSAIACVCIVLFQILEVKAMDKSIHDSRGEKLHNAGLAHARLNDDDDAASATSNNSNSKTNVLKYNSSSTSLDMLHTAPNSKDNGGETIHDELLEDNSSVKTATIAS